MRVAAATRMDAALASRTKTCTAYPAWPMWETLAPPWCGPRPASRFDTRKRTPDAQQANPLMGRCTLPHVSQPHRARACITDHPPCLASGGHRVALLRGCPARESTGGPASKNPEPNKRTRARAVAPNPHAPCYRGHLYASQPAHPACSSPVLVEAAHFPASPRCQAQRPRSGICGRSEQLTTSPAHPHARPGGGRCGF